jgi:hypothetical protein
MVEPPRLRRADQYVAPTPESPHIRFVVTPVGGKLWWILDCPREGKQSIQEGTLLDIDGCD